MGEFGQIAEVTAQTLSDGDQEPGSVLYKLLTLGHWRWTISDRHDFALFLHQQFSRQEFSMGLWQGVPQVHLNQTLKCHSLRCHIFLLFTKARPLNPLIFLCVFILKGNCIPTTSVDTITCRIEYKSDSLQNYCHLLQAQRRTPTSSVALWWGLLWPSAVSEEGLFQAVFFSRCLDPALAAHSTSEPRDDSSLWPLQFLLLNKYLLYLP